jgi:hypothetical protein
MQRRLRTRSVLDSVFVIFFVDFVWASESCGLQEGVASCSSKQAENGSKGKKKNADVAEVSPVPVQMWQA